MKILNINFVNFRNLKDTKIELSPNINLFYGKNAQGKTSILEAIYFSAMGISFRTKHIIEIMKYSSTKFGTFMEIENEYGVSNLSVKYINKTNASKQFCINNKVKNQSDLFGYINIIAYVPEDIALINASPSTRRNYFDIEISQFDKNYLLNLKNYNKILKIRNKYIKENNIFCEEFEIYNKTFIEYNAKLILYRYKYINKLSKILNEFYQKLFAHQEVLNITYEASAIEINKEDNLESLEEKISKELKKLQTRELKYGYSLLGAHKDDYKIFLNNKEAKITASQGEKKSIIFALKLSEIELIKKYKKENPVVLIDDITSYFDKTRREAILNYLKRKCIQVIISSTDDIEFSDKKFFVKEGTIYDNL